MYGIKKFITGIIIGVLVGLWIGVNVGKKQPLWANPLENKTIADKAKASTDEILKDAKRVLREQLKD